MNYKTIVKVILISIVLLPFVGCEKSAPDRLEDVHRCYIDLRANRDTVQDRYYCTFYAKRIDFILLKNKIERGFDVEQTRSLYYREAKYTHFRFIVSPVEKPKIEKLIEEWRKENEAQQPE